MNRSSGKRRCQGQGAGLEPAGKEPLGERACASERAVGMIGGGADQSPDAHLDAGQDLGWCRGGG